MSEYKTPKKLKPLKITCTSTDCENGLHCFLQKRRQSPIHGPCRECGVNLVDWPRVHARNLDDVQHTVSALQQERIRHHFWHAEIDQKAINHARRKGFCGMETAVRQRLRNSIGRKEHPIEGRQTGRSGNVIYYAQHATATCCRYCLEEWHGVTRDHDLTDGEIEYLAEVVTHYIKKRLPNLSEDGERVPPIRRRSSKRTTKAS